MSVHNCPSCECVQQPTAWDFERVVSERDAARDEVRRLETKLRGRFSPEDIRAVVAGLTGLPEDIRRGLLGLADGLEER